MHPLKDQREGVKYGRGVKYGVTPVTQKFISEAVSGNQSGFKWAIIGIYAIAVLRFYLKCMFK